jgi:molybdopterin/thiamine biosynthesis adenylyltransferase/rhodanese-related sulfurtransferase
MAAESAIATPELWRRLGQANPPLLLDVRESYEREIAFIQPSLHLPLASLDGEIAGLVPDRNSEIVCYCSKGQRSAEACKRLVSLGYARARTLVGGLAAWSSAGAPTQHGTRRQGEYSPRYARQVCLPEVGPGGQRKLLSARVLIVGAGGLGSPAAFYLAAAGVGTLGLVDYDVVDESNLHRQILYRTQDVGQSKVQVAQRALEALNPDIRVVPYPERFVAANAERIVREFDLVLDGADNFAARYLVNDVCLLLGKPNVHGAVHQFEGQVSVLGHNDAPCYRCLFPEPPPPGWVPSCAQAGVLGVLPGMIGTLQAAEAVKLILGLGDLLCGRLLRIDALAMTFGTFEVSKRSDCVYCGNGRAFPGLVDYEEHCDSA